MAEAHSSEDWATQKPRILQLYRRAHDFRSLDFEKKALELDDKAVNLPADSDSKRDAIAQAQRVRALKGKQDFEDWLLEDKALFEKMDTSKNGSLDQAEFREFAITSFGMTENEAKDIFKKWDIDEGGQVGPFEFSIMMSIYHTEVMYQEAVEQSQHIIMRSVPCACCVPFACYIGCCFSLCTLGLSWIPMYCITSAAVEQGVDDLSKEAKLQEQNRKVSEKARQTAKERLKSGPPRDILTRDDSSSVSGARQ